MKIRLAIITTIFALLPHITDAATQTINTLPQSDANFISNLQTFLRSESANRDAVTRFNPVTDGGIGATSANLTHTISAVIGFPEGYYTSDGPISHTYTASKRTFVYLRRNDAETITLASATITYDDNFVFAEFPSSTAQPNTPPYCTPLMIVDTDGTAISSVVDIRAGELQAENYSSLSAACTAAGERKVVLNEPYSIVASTTCNGPVEIKPNSIITLTSTYNLTLNNAIIAGDYKIVDYQGTGELKGTARGNKISLYWFGAVGDDTTDNSTAIDNWLEFVQQTHGVGFIPYGNFKFTAAINQTGGSYSIEGVGQRLSQLCPTGATASITIGSANASLVGNIWLRNFGIRGDDTTTPSGTAGLIMNEMNFSSLTDVEVRNIDGYGIYINSCQDVALRSCQLMHNGNYTAQEQGLYIAKNGTNAVNSISIVDVHIERTRYHAVEVAATAGSVNFVRGKIHGRLVADEATPKALDAIRITGGAGDRISIIGMQLAHCRYRCIYVEGNGEVTAIGNTMTAMVNYETPANGAWGIYADNDSNIYAEGNIFSDSSLSGDVSYATNGGDIRIKDGVEAFGENLHLTSHTNPVNLTDATSPNHPRLEALNLQRVAGNYALKIGQIGDNANGPGRFRIIPSGNIAWGNGTDAVDTNLYRNGADWLKTDDHLQVLDGIATRVVSSHTGVTDDDTTVDINGTMVINDNDSNLYIRMGGTWHAIAIP